MHWTLYHNPRCSKSRQALALLEDRRVQTEVVRYLETPPDANTLRDLLRALGMTARELVRFGEEDCKLHELTKDSTDEDCLAAMLASPRLIERPIFSNGQRAVIGRPPERVLELLDSERNGED